MPAVPGLIDLINVPGVRGRISACPYPSVNALGSDGTVVAERVLRDLAERFRREGKGAYWWRGGPRPGPDAAMLRAAGFEFNEYRIVALALADLQPAIPLERNVTVRDAGRADYQLLLDIFVRGFSTPQDFAEVFLAALLMTDYPCRFYLGYVGDQPAAMSWCTYFQDRPIAVLAGAATLPEHRGRGVYRAIIDRRIKDARAAGMSAVVIEAQKATSVPILKQLGFEELYEFERYALAPPDSASSASIGSS